LKLLTLIRHAKSSWRDAGMDDFDRPLNDRGERDAPRMGKRLARAGRPPDLIVSSSAKRAARTARVISEQLGSDPAAVVLDRDLYLASPSRMLDTLRAVAADLDHAALVAHNPGVTDLVNALADVRIDNVPTCGIARLRLDIERWNEIDAGCAELEEFDYPKRDRAG
jgi:phosphohistidine phosphatase